MGFSIHFKSTYQNTQDVLSRLQTWNSVYKWQHVYLPILYGFLAIKVRIEDVLSLWVQ